MVRLLAKLPEPGTLLGDDGNGDAESIDMARARYTQWINQILQNQLDIIQLVFFDQQGQERFWLDRDKTTQEWQPTVDRPEPTNQDFIRTARSKGLTERSVVLVHALRNAILPVIAMIGLDIGIFMAGAVVVESVYGWPGIGQMAWQAIQMVDIPIIMGATLVAAVGIVLGNLLADLVIPFIDPRVYLR